MAAKTTSKMAAQNNKLSYDLFAAKMNKIMPYSANEDVLGAEVNDRHASVKLSTDLFQSQMATPMVSEVYELMHKYCSVPSLVE